MLCILFDEYPAEELPRDQAELYKKFVAWLLGKLGTYDAGEQLRDRVKVHGPEAERAVASLLNHLVELLEDVAYQRQQAGQLTEHSSLLAAAATWPGCRPPADVLPGDEWTTVVAHVLRACGLLVERGDGFEFLHPTVAEYLAARHIDRTRGRRAFAARREFAPQHEWPWPDLQVKVFLAAMWSDRMRAPLIRLLKRRHNVGFVVELARYGFELDDDLRARTTAALRALIRAAPVMADWQRAVRWLRELDSNQASAMLAQVADAGNQPEPRREEAIRQLLEIDPDVAFSRMTTLVADARNEPATRMAMARLAFTHDPDRGMTMYRILAASPGLGDNLRLEAAEVAAGHDPSGLELLAALRDHHRNHDALRLDAALAYRRRVPGAGLISLVALGRDVLLGVETRFRIAHLVAGWDQNAADDLFTAIANHRAFDFGTRTRAIREFAETLGRPPSWAADLIRDPREEVVLRMAAAWTLGRFQPRDAAGLLRELADEGRCGRTAEVTALQLASLLRSPDKAITPVPDEGRAGVDRIEVARVVHQIAGPSYALSLLVHLAEDEGRLAVRLAAATAACEIDDGVGLRLLTQLGQAKISARNRFTVAETIAARYGPSMAEPVFKAVAAEAPNLDIGMQAARRLRAGARVDALVLMSRNALGTAEHRLTAAIAAQKDNRSKGNEALEGLAKSDLTYSIRMRAVDHISDKRLALRLYDLIAGSTHGNNRLRAATAAADLDPRAATLRKIAADRGVPRSVRKAAQQELTRRKLD
jgi:hypothetical protein